jgi:hypothetical protein
MDWKMNANQTHTLVDLESKRTQLRGRLALAWETREPLDQIRQIEAQIRSLWDEIDAVQQSRCVNSSA